MRRTKLFFPNDQNVLNRTRLIHTRLIRTRLTKIKFGCPYTLVIYKNTSSFRDRLDQMSKVICMIILII